MLVRFLSREAVAVDAAELAVRTEALALSEPVVCCERVVAACSSSVQ